MCEVVINGTTYVPKKTEIDGMECVCIRSYAAGVHVGYLKSKTPTPSGVIVELVNSRRIWKWEGAASLSQLAIDGVSGDSRIAKELPLIEIVGVIEIIPLSEKARTNIYSQKEWTA